MMKTIVNVTFKTLLNEEDLKATTSKDLPLLAEVPGLISKSFLVYPDTGSLGAIYQFKNEKAADFYLGSPFFKSMGSRYHVVDNTLSVEKAQLNFVLEGLNTAGNNRVVSMNWREITTEASLERAIATSSQKPVLIFKHSNRCPVSRSVLRRLDGLLRHDAPDRIDYYLLDVISYRTLSDSIAEMLEVEHASPQVLLIKNRSCIYHANQMKIDGTEIIERAEIFTEYQLNS